VATLRRLAFLIIGSAAFLLLAAAPVLADGGPHTATVNSGSTGISADSCAGCHRAHTAQGQMLLVQDAAALCLTCHGSTGTGATTDVMDGIQYAVSSDPTQVRGSGVLGALRAGGFQQARIGSGSAARLAYLSGSSVRQMAAVPVLAQGQDVTSVHMDPLATQPVLAPAWGNGALGSSGAGGTTGLTCVSCHNPHGNGQYRILNPIPVGDGGTMTAAATSAFVDDAPLPAPGDARNYTVIQQKGTEGTPSTYLLYASQIGSYTATTGDYFHRKVPWNSSTGANDAPNGKPSTFNTQINAWCSQCHTRYLAVTGAPFEEYSGDAIFSYRHSNTSNKPCTTCHVAHGSNAVMSGIYSSTETMPDGSAAPGDSRLLKIDNRGTCQACHDPTGTIQAGTQIGTPPVVP
jgi:predicted CXXCH cytochrome family protein